MSGTLDIFQVFLAKPGAGPPRRLKRKGRQAAKIEESTFFS